jgi:hypothetical protein
MLAGSQWMLQVPYLTIVFLALGTVAQLAAIMMALRAAAESAEVAAPKPFGQVLASTLMPFLLVYAAFGYLDGYSTAQVWVGYARYSYFDFADFAGAMNPVEGGHWWAVIAVMVGLYALRILLGKVLQQRPSIAVGCLAAVAETGFLYLTVFTVLWIADIINQWIFHRVFTGWWEAAVGLLPELPLAWPDWLEAAWGWFWPVFWEVLSQPLAWLAVAAVVVGIKSESADDLVKDKSKVARGGFKILRMIYGQIESRLLPMWHALRRGLRVGFPFVGALVLGFTGLSWLSDAVSNAAGQLTGTFNTAAYATLLPFVTFAADVVFFGLKLLLLAAGLRRMTAEKDAREEAGPEAPLPTRQLVGQGVVVTAVCAAVALIRLVTVADGDFHTYLEPGNPAQLYGYTVQLDPPQAGDAVTLSGLEPAEERTFTSRGVILLFPAWILNREANVDLGVVYELRVGEHTYQPWRTLTWSVDPGFRNNGSLIFEIAAEDAGQEAEVVISPNSEVSFSDRVVNYWFTVPERVARTVVEPEAVRDVP